jgi:hypothetical protein
MFCYIYLQVCDIILHATKRVVEYLLTFNPVTQFFTDKHYFTFVQMEREKRRTSLILNIKASALWGGEPEQPAVKYGKYKQIKHEFMLRKTNNVQKWRWSWQKVSLHLSTSLCAIILHATNRVSKYCLTCIPVTLFFTDMPRYHRLILTLVQVPTQKEREEREEWNKFNLKH